MYHTYYTYVVVIRFECLKNIELTITKTKGPFRLLSPPIVPILVVYNGAKLMVLCICNIMSYFDWY